MKYRIQVLVYFKQHKRPQWSKKKLKQLSRHMTYTLLTHIKKNIHYYILNLNTTVYKNKELQNNAAIVFKTSSATGKKFKKDTLHRGGNI